MPNGGVNDLQGLVADLSLASATPAELLGWQQTLRNWVASLHTDQPARMLPAARLALELAAYLLFAATVLEFFVPELIAGRLASLDAAARQAAETGTDGPLRSRTLGALASARHTLAFSPAGSLTSTGRFRDEWEL